MSQTLAVKYRPASFDDVVEQDSIKTILKQQLATNSTKNAYLFCGGAGTGKTTCARIFANEINHHEGHPIEIDAASNSGVDDVREIIKQAQTKSIDSEYKIFIIDECHSLSNTAWQAFLKLIEEPPAKSIFIFCTTDPQKIPKTILSRVQRYDFQRISIKGIADRLHDICIWEKHYFAVGTINLEITDERFKIYHPEALEYIAKLADGGMRDAITMLDKCLSYSTELTVENVIKALGTTDYETMFKLTDAMFTKDVETIISTIESVHSAGKDLKQFIKQYLYFVLDLTKYSLVPKYDFITIPNNFRIELRDYTSLLHTIVKLNERLRYETASKQLIEATLLLRAMGE